MADWEVFRQDVFDGEKPPEGAGWEPFAAQAELNRQRESLGGDWADGEIVWWRRRMVACHHDESQEGGFDR